MFALEIAFKMSEKKAVLAPYPAANPRQPGIRERSMKQLYFSTPVNGNASDRLQRQQDPGKQA